MLRKQAEPPSLTPQQVKIKRVEAEAVERQRIAEDAANQAQDKYNILNAVRNGTSDKRRLMESKALWDARNAEKVCIEARKKEGHARHKRIEAYNKSSKAKSDNEKSRAAFNTRKEATAAIEKATFEWRTTKAKQEGLKTKIKAVTREARRCRTRESFTAPMKTTRTTGKWQHRWTHEIKAKKLAKTTEIWDKEIARLTESRNGWNKKWAEKKRQEAMSRNSLWDKERKRAQVSAARARDKQARAELKLKILERDIKRSMLSIGHSKNRIRTATGLQAKAKEKKEAENMNKQKAMMDIQTAKRAINKGAFKAWKARNRKTRSEYNCSVAKMGRELSENLALLTEKDTKALEDTLNFRLTGTRCSVSDPTLKNKKKDFS